MNLHEFLLARIGEDEAWARSVDDIRPPAETIAAMVAAGLFPSWLIARATPSATHVRVECEAKRRILALHPERNGECPTCNRAWREKAVDGGGQSSAGLEPSPCPTVRALGLPYADHAEYREEWLAR